MPLDLNPLYDDLTFVSPMSESRATELLSLFSEMREGLIVDVGCGWGELLLRAVQVTPGTTGLGVDLDADAIAHGQALADARGLGDRVRLVAGDAAETVPPAVDAAICVGASQIWGVPHEPALTHLRSMVQPGGRVLYADSIWAQPPTDAALAAFEGGPHDFGSLTDLIDTAVGAGFRPLRIGEASLDEWDHFESGFAMGYERWLATHPASHPDTAQVQERADTHRARWLGGYRGILGFAYLSLIAR
jgi:SAM-dependent methyltransferase